MRYLLTWAMAAAMTVAVSFVPAKADNTASALFQSYLGKGRISEADEQMLALATKASGNADARLGLGMVRTARALEHLSQALYKYGFATEMPAMRLIGLSGTVFSTNPDPQPITYRDFRDILATFLADLEKADQTLAEVGDSPAKLTVDLSVTRFDWNGDGTIDERDHIGAAISDLDDAGKPKPFIVAFDTADAKWLRGYCNFLMALTKTLLSHDMSRSWDAGFGSLFPRAVSGLAKANGVDGDDGLGMTLFGTSKRDTDAIADLISLVHTIDWPVADKAMWLEVRGHFKTVIRLNRETWGLIAKETDDDHEWLPGPRQKSGVLPSLEVTQERIDSWLALLGQVDEVLDGKLLMPHWRFAKGINLARVFEQPGNFDLVLWITGPGALPYLDNGKVMDAEAWGQATRIFGGDVASYAFYFN
ncbi:hypothetical protein RNI52_26815 [Labrys neptuniae]|uniref:hypothetical protein n=1 Tax=Labrys neptuniae TaxID=376174 RepID=UPI00288EFAA8|nr:hypothetical protein [Labrys neptuniae]MDT3380968.1 hypothetical protein [Labrys neptuniae]